MVGGWRAARTQWLGKQGQQNIPEGKGLSAPWKAAGRLGKCLEGCRVSQRAPATEQEEAGGGEEEWVSGCNSCN